MIKNQNSSLRCFFLFQVVIEEWKDFQNRKKVFQGQTVGLLDDSLCKCIQQNHGSEQEILKCD